MARLQAHLELVQQTWYGSVTSTVGGPGSEFTVVGLDPMLVTLKDAILRAALPGAVVKHASRPEVDDDGTPVGLKLDVHLEMVANQWLGHVVSLSPGAGPGTEFSVNGMDNMLGKLRHAIITAGLSPVTTPTSNEAA